MGVPSETIEVKLARIDERTAAMSRRLEDLTSEFVPRAEFMPVKSVVYGLVGCILVAVFTAVLTLVLRGANGAAP